MNRRTTLLLVAAMFALATAASAQQTSRGLKTVTRARQHNTRAMPAYRSYRQYGYGGRGYYYHNGQIRHPQLDWRWQAKMQAHRRYAAAKYRARQRNLVKRIAQQKQRAKR